MGTILAATLVLLPWCSLLAQQNNAGSDKKIIITKRSVDADGSETTETIVKKGKAAENFDVDQYVRDNKKENVDVDVRIEEGDEEVHIINRRSDHRHSNWSNNNNGQCFNILGFNDDKQGFLGVEQDSDEDSDQEGLVVEVVRGSAAEKAGLKTNDLILKLNDRKVDAWDDLTDFMANTKPGDKIKVSYSRSGKTNTTEAVLTKHSEVKALPAEKEGFLGVSSKGDDDEDRPGVEVSVIKNSGAEKAGLKTGDVILQLNDTEIRDWEDLEDLINTTKPGEKLRIQYERAGKRNTVDAELGEQKAWDWQAAMPAFNAKNWSINVREKEACLGVYSQAYGDGDGTEVEEFTAESAARDASMNVGDVITAVNGSRVKDHDALWNEIAKYKPGEKVKVDFLRDNQQRSIEATLKACRNQSNEVTIDNTDEEGDNQSRQFYIWNWEDNDGNRLRERRIITIRKGAEGDAAKVNTAPENKPAQDRTLNLEGFRAYPNPTQGQVTVEFRGEPVSTIVSLFDLSGRQLFREELNAFNGEYNQQFDLTDYAKGTILVHIQQGEKVFTEQLIVN